MYKVVINVCPGVVWNPFLVYDALVVYLLSIILHLSLKGVAQVHVHRVPFVYLFCIACFYYFFSIV